MSLTQITILFISATGVNSIAVYAQRRYKLYTRWFGRYDWAAHVVLLSVVWAVFLFAIFFQNQLPVWRMPSILRPLGIIVLVLGIFLVVSTWKRLGTEGTTNGWFFGRGPLKQLIGGVFRIHDPMYVGFILLFVGAGFWLENAAYLWLAATSYLLLNIILSYIERPTIRHV